MPDWTRCSPRTAPSSKDAPRSKRSKRDRWRGALDAFEDAIAAAPDYAAAHVGMANALMMRFEMTRTDPSPDTASLTRSIHHAREACRLDARSAEGWATLGFVLGRTGARVDALAARRARRRSRTRQLAPSLPPGQYRAGAKSGCAPPTGRSRSFRSFRSPTGWRPRSTSPGRSSTRPNGSLPPAWHRSRRAQSSAPSPCIGCAVSFTWRGATTDGRSRTSSRSWRARAPATCIHANAARTRGTPSARSDGARAAMTRRRPRSTKRSARVATHPMALVALDRGPGSPSDRLVLAVAQAAVARHDECPRRGGHRRRRRACPTRSPATPGWFVPVEPTLHVTARPDVWAEALARLRHRAA